MEPDRGPYLRISANRSRGEEDADEHFFVAITSWREEAGGGPELVPWVADIAHEILEAGLGRAYADGYRIHAGMRCQDADTVEEAARALRVLARTAPEARYPITFWLCPVGATGAAWAVVESNAEKMDPERFQDALRAGAIWLSFMNVFFDLISDVAAADMVMRWTREAASASTVPVEWSVEGPD